MVHDAGLTISTDMGLTIGAYVAQRENNTPVGTSADAVRDEFNGAWYAKYSAGPVSIGFSSILSRFRCNWYCSSEAATAAKVVRTAGGVL